MYRSRLKYLMFGALTVRMAASEEKHVASSVPGRLVVDIIHTEKQRSLLDLYSSCFSFVSIIAHIYH